MCGIHLLVWQNASCDICRERFSTKNDYANLCHRGPDATEGISLDEPAPNNYHKVHLQASVLQMRHDLVTQPVCIGENAYFCWNGEVYQQASSSSDEEEPLDVWDFDTSDTLLVAKHLESILLDEEQSQQQQKIAQVMSQFYNAEFAFLILTPTMVYYGRDAWGRRSLLRWDCPSCGSFQIVSVPEVKEEHEEQQWTEVLPGKVHQTSLLSTIGNKQPRQPASIPFPTLESPLVVAPLPSIPPPDGVSHELWTASLELEFHLSRAVQMRMDQHSSRGCSTAVLFSGGLDSAVVAALAAQHCSSTSPQQKLLLHNVSFGPSHDKSADRQAALTTFEVLRERYDDHVEFRDIVVEWQDICQHEPHIRTLLQPKTTLMDVNIATALWFASRGGGGGGGGKRSSPSEAEDTSRPPRVLLLGMGADEQMGGYGRHRKAYERGGWDELQSELKMDQDRFWERNLGRDDRICADHGTEARFPFLDAHVVQFLQRLPLHLVCDFSLPPGQGDKRILRLVAQRLGLDHASGLVKRAIQFGSRISHLSDAKRFGSRRKAKGEATVKKNAA